MDYYDRPTGQRRKTMFCKVGGAANALSLCRDNTKVVVAGRSLLKIFSIDDNAGQFHEVKNLHVGRRQGLNMSSSDVAWCPNDENLIATAATNGAVVAWDLTATTRSKQLVVFSEHLRTVTKVSFHPVEAPRLISGSQDGLMKMFDLRKKECTNTFNSRADGVRSVQFSPFNHFFFAASFDNGTVQVWDYRRGNTYVSQFIAHKGSVYTLNWHPDVDEKNTIATGGRDNMVKIWDVSHERVVKETSSIPTTSSVASVSWRPNRHEQLATTSILLDFNINVWDLRRKYVPFAYFDDHRDVPTGIAWRHNDPCILFSCSKDGVLFMHTIQEAVRPGDDTHTTGFDFSSLGYMCLADEKFSTFSPRSQSPTGGYTKLPAIFGNWKGSGGFQGSDQDDLFFSSPTIPNPKIKHFLQAQSNLKMISCNLLHPVACSDLNDILDAKDFVFEHLSMRGFVYAAMNYRLDGMSCCLSFNELCEHNSEVALKAGFSDAARTWRLLAQFYGTDDNNNENVTSLNRPANVTGTPIPRTMSDVTADKTIRNEKDSKRPSLISKKDESHGSQVFPIASGAESEIHSEDGRIEIEDYLTDIARGRHSEPDFYFSDDDAIPSFGYDGATSEADFLTDQEWGAMRVPSEAFIQKEDLDIESIAKFGHVDAPSAVTNLSIPKKTVLTPHGGRWHPTAVTTRDEIASSPSPPADAEERYITEKNFVVNPSEWPDPLKVDRDKLTCEQLQWFADKNDVQTAVCIMLALSANSVFTNLRIDEWVLEHWQTSYLNLLAKHELWVQHQEVVKLSKIHSIRALSASSTVHLSCTGCQRRLPSNSSWPGDRRSEQEHQNKSVFCFLCKLVVNGVYTYCQGCSLGGHFKCVEMWMKQERRNGMCRNHCL